MVKNIIKKYRREEKVYRSPLNPIVSIKQNEPAKDTLKKSKKSQKEVDNNINENNNENE